jgi:polar amino acid transport system substrate-binding protein
MFSNQVGSRGPAKYPYSLSRNAVRTVAIALIVISGAYANIARAAEAITPPPSIAAAKTIVYCTDLTAPPVDFMDENTKPTGSDIDIGNEIAARLGVKVAWNNIPFKGLIPA